MQHMIDWTFERMEQSRDGVTVSWEFKGDGKFGEYDRLRIGDRPYMRLVVQVDGETYDTKTQFDAKKWFHDKYVSLMYAHSFVISELDKGAQMKAVMDKLSTINADNYKSFNCMAPIDLSSINVS